MRVSLTVKHWAHNPGTDNASPSSILGPASKYSINRILTATFNFWNK